MLARLTDKTSIRLAIFALLALALVWPALADAGKLNEFRDAQVLMMYERAAVDTVKQFGQLPLWNPYYCGGLDGLGAPQSRFASPTFLVSLLFGPERAEIVLVFLLAVIGMEGTFRFVRTRVESPIAATLVAPVFALSGYFAVSFYRGWTAFFGVELVPWILLGVTRAARGRISGVALASIVFAIVLGFGGTFAAPLVAVVATLEAIRSILERPRSDRARAFAMLAATASFMATVAAVRLWPLAETLRAAPRIMAGTPGHMPKAILSALVGELAVKDGDVHLVGSFFVGAVFLGVVALGASNRRAIGSLVVTIVLFWLAAGYARKPALFALLRELPIFSALRYPERFLWLAILYACEPAAHALAKIPYLGEGRRWRVGSWIVLGAAMTWTVASEITTFHRVAGARILGAITPDAPPHGFHQARGNRWLVAHEEARGVGSLSCWETHPVLESPKLRGDLPQEEYALGPGSVARLMWSPNAITLRADLEAPGTIAVNQNWHPGWRASIGRVVSDDGLLAVELPAGPHVVALAFRPWSATAGLLVTNIALLALGMIALRGRAGRRPFARGSRIATAVIVLLPWGVAVAAVRLSPEPPWPELAPRNANGTPALVAAADRDAAPLGASFALPVKLEAGKVTGPDDHANILVDLYLRRTGSIPRSTAVFVHVEHRGHATSTGKDDEPRDMFNADHQVIARTFFLSDAPEGKLVHDAFGVHLDKALPGTWDVWVAFGHVSGRRGRAKVTDAAGATVDDDRVKVGTFEVR